MVKTRGCQESLDFFFNSLERSVDVQTSAGFAGEGGVGGPNTGVEL